MSAISQQALRNRIRNLNLLEYKCHNPKCIISDSWLDNPITLDLDHIDGNHYNNEISNLRWLCPNCHRQQITSNRPKNKREYKLIDLENEIVDEYKSGKSIRYILVKYSFCEASSNYRTIKSILKKYGLSYEKRWVLNPDKMKNRKHTRKVKRPEKEELISLIKEKPLTTIAKIFNVTDNSVRKWCKYYNINHKIISPFCHKV